MFILNNSTQTWEDYQCGGGHKVTLRPGEIVEVQDSIGRFLLRMLGHENWLIEVERPVKAEKPKVEKPKAKRSIRKKSSKK